MAMQRYVIEREIPGASQMTQEQLRDASGHSNKVLAEMGEGIRWDHSYVAGDKFYCVYDAEDVSLIGGSSTGTSTNRPFFRASATVERGAILRPELALCPLPLPSGSPEPPEEIPTVRIARSVAGTGPSRSSNG